MFIDSMDLIQKPSFTVTKQKQVITKLITDLTLKIPSSAF